MENLRCGRLAYTSQYDSFFPFSIHVHVSLRCVRQRHAWLPYFDRVNAVIFLAPISCFDERLTEDPRVNRLEDSLILWRAICSSRLLSRTILILFLNKMDILEKKIRDGIMVNRFLPSYGHRPNETSEVVKCKSFLHFA
jgi:guanine nucleotide-binding protein alpha-1 subunit